MDDAPPSLADFSDLLPLAHAWRHRDAGAAPEELAKLVRTVEPRIEALNDFLDDQPPDREGWPEDIRALKDLADRFNAAAFEDTIWRLAFPSGPPD
jgi:hypothetical protein